jgi:hypothetical protein
MRLDRWRRQLAGVMTRSLQQGLNRANENWHDHFIMAWDGFIIRPAEFVGNRSSKPLNQMGRACNSPEAAWNRQDDDGFSPWIGSMKGLSTTLQVDSEIWLFDMNYSVIVSWGVLSQCFRAVFLLWFSRISPEPTLDSFPLEFSSVSFLNHLAQKFLSVATSGHSLSPFQVQNLCLLIDLHLECPPSPLAEPPPS